MSYSPLPVTFRAGLGHVTSPPLAATGTFGAGLLDRRAGTTERLQRPVAVASHAEAPLTLVGSPGGEVDTFGVSTWAGAFGDVERAGHGIVHVRLPAQRDVCRSQSRNAETTAVSFSHCSSAMVWEVFQSAQPRAQSRPRAQWSAVLRTVGRIVIAKVIGHLQHRPRRAFSGYRARHGRGRRS